MRRCNSPKMDDLGLVRTVFGSRLLLPRGWALTNTVPLLRIRLLFSSFSSLTFLITHILYSTFLMMDDFIILLLFFSSFCPHRLVTPRLLALGLAGSQRCLLPTSSCFTDGGLFYHFVTFSATSATRFLLFYHPQ